MRIFNSITGRAHPIELIVPADVNYDWREHISKSETTSDFSICFAHTIGIDGIQSGNPISLAPNVQFPFINSVTTPTRLTIVHVRGLTLVDP